MSNTTVTNNPLLIGQGLPPFDKITPDYVIPAMTELLQELETKLKDLETNVKPTWEGLVEPLTEIEEKFSWSWGIVGHLMGVKNSPELRNAYETVQPQVIQFINTLSQSQPIYSAYKTLQESDSWNSLDNAQKRIVETAIREAELSGVALTGETREKFNKIQLELAELSTKFSNHVLDATKAFKLKLTTEKEVEGLPASLLSLAAQTARSEGEENATPETGPWVITLDYPSYVPFMKYSSHGDLREKVYKAFISRASNGELDNNPLIKRILELRKQQAEILGYNTYAEVSLARKMAPNVETVEGLLEELRTVSYDAAVHDLETLKNFSKNDSLEPWDVSYWAEKQRETLFNFTAEELRPYFPLPQVLDGLFSLAKRIFGVTIISADGQAPIWQEDVRYFQVNNEAGEAIAHFYLDPYSRPSEKRGGAWMNDCIGRAKMRHQEQFITRLPVAYLVCNQTPPVDGKPSLMTFDEVTTLFHEFGHGLQHMLTKVDYPGAAGINNVEWDAVELPSQFMENWCYDRTTLFNMAKHYETGETLPEHYYDKLVSARNYMSGSAMLRQLHFSFLDLELHHRYQPNGKETHAEVRNRIAEKTTVMKPLPEDAFLCAFGHIFSGGYAAGYYSYKWAEVLSADAFSAFEEVGLNDEKAVAQTGKRFRDTVLALGGSVNPMEVFKAFRGREPQTEPLLRHSGLLKAA
ncbi:M3 family metallopeptidase [Crocosphaera sp.]|uniref:M3 family metallopeptidase n=1 Tax=Crocosphaera sp. TaxID=2729996 RepID=UPI00261D1C9D|nr:M3 family metallopeptidase [Crocosphaera sp.]MDJ0582063.1 M3 family metallopeptidase [Crocosphaera sp.]